MNLDLAVWLLSGVHQSGFLNLVMNLATCGVHGALRIFGDVCGPWWCPILVVFPLGPPNLRGFWSPAAVADGDVGGCPFKKGSVAGGLANPFHSLIAFSFTSQIQ